MLIARLLSIAFILVAAGLLAACGALGSAAPLSGVTASTDSIVPGSSGIGRPAGAIEVRYTLGSAADVSAQLQGPASSTLLAARQEAGSHILRFSGVISATNSAQPSNDYRVMRQVVPSGNYTITVAAGAARESVRFKVSDANNQPPTIGNLVVRPQSISPNSDAIDDVAQVTFRTSETTTLSVDLASADGTVIPALAPSLHSAGEQSVVITGRNLLGETLPDGAYTVTVSARDEAGNLIEAQRPLKIEGGGKPQVQIVKVEITPQQIILGNSIAVSITVKNIGNVPLRTQGPDKGYTYTTNDSYSSVEGNKWVDKAGLWRVGVDWDGNSGGGPSRYPFRWGFGHTLMPGETVVTGGKITILKQESTMWFYAGVLQEGVRIVLDRLGRSAVKVSF
ncbi:MAG: hypothetical protein IVW55_15985 [Chloroflexi bacterium]|nr:hypothetical protein [Chloroflexota bacterium]